MGRFFHNKKHTVEGSLCISLKKLREWGYLKGYKTKTNLSWKNTESSISTTIFIAGSQPRMELSYTITKSYGEEQNFSYSVRLVTTPCRFGGIRYWFLCPIRKNGQYCGRKVMKLYSPPSSGYFGCRFCHDLTYTTRQEHKHRLEIFGKVLDCEEKMDELCASIKRTYYAGKPTKKYSKYCRYRTWHERLSPTMYQNIKSLPLFKKNI